MVELSPEWTQYKHRRSRYYVTGNQETFSTETMTLILHPIIINQTWPGPGWCLEKIPKTRKSFDFQIPLVYWLMSPFLPWHLIGGKVHLIFYRPLNWMRCQGRCWRIGPFLPWQLITSTLPSASSAPLPTSQTLPSGTDSGASQLLLLPQVWNLKIVKNIYYELLSTIHYFYRYDHLMMSLKFHSFPLPTLLVMVVLVLVLTTACKCRQ